MQKNIVITTIGGSSDVNRQLLYANKMLDEIYGVDRRERVAYDR